MAKSPKKRRPAKKLTRIKVTGPSLTILQKRACDIYHAMKKPSKLKACRLAQYKMGGKHARNEAQKTFDLSHVKAYLDSLKATATENAQRSADEIIAELEKIGFANMADYVTFDENGVKLNDSKKLTRNQLAAVSEVTEVSTKYGKRKAFRLYDKPECLHLLGKRHALFPNRQEVTGKDGKPIEHKVSVVHFSKKKK